MIRKIKGKYVVISETTGRRFGAYKTLKAAKKRLRQVEFFKRLNPVPFKDRCQRHQKIKKSLKGAG
ncbi:MAG: hypothetical protein A3I88_01485 [Candidatus Portnoybacteria bacterium RIFCSPLOWO2_12_FULL_39_9]|uniref:Uncharacterized protein n=1 Tax=Candidatus Portnoybacteria bacterium RIFCSPHIGHO2_12_FULL_38_9 TaxID=1801997 RepID=A0A1G2FGF1_9BACT|nr:MAG: hypothetical protein A2646_02025 [Candidatus Portnoybacteria bacterium RIFCSPHIGHO2_02_FULL_39_12]OGZ36887.1 MAG: hypothetical protein A3J64_03565 [Candidatus Portnoybacteria bacterium RIFCSPHIGHO2_12_FULL_38_9]OGZ38717.1 MAG: hypothetical protein A3F21_01315 [Candidatus Portnoybacteria bacterium RIFCSPLOWO2_01_FULL_38_39]OGZ40569.1 MAG: hypothetical protein A3I88_01485 [Candidatus Portnoybacteria bacterium RIFCSPLOWO2_12_FULL_39_9]